MRHLPPLFIPNRLIMFSKDKFHNQLALHLGYDRIVKDKQFNIKIEDEDVPRVIEIAGSSAKIKFIASDEISEVLDKMNNYEQIKALGIGDEISTIINAVHTAYIESTKELATF